jgi:hypothetical protein
MRSIGLLLLFSAAVFGQRAGNAIRGGNVVYPGTGRPPTVIQHPGPTFGGVARRGAIGPHAGVRRQHGGNSVVYLPYTVGVPVYPDPSGPPAPMYDPQPQAPQAPPVVINQYFVPETAPRPVVREYATDANGGVRVYGPDQSVAVESNQRPTSENPSYLIAFKDHTIYAAIAYWVEDSTLHYVTNQNTHNQVSLDLVDRELSGRLNRERNVDFRLPPPGR